MSDSDDHLFERLLHSNKATSDLALEEIFYKYGQSLINYARRYTKVREASEDIVQNVFLAIWRNRRSLVIEKGLKVYLFRAVRNQALNVLRDAHSEKDMHAKNSFTISPSKELPDPVEYEELRRAIQQAISSLPTHCREIFLLSRIDGLSYADIAELLGISVKTVETQMGRALRGLRNLLAGDHI